MKFKYIPNSLICFILLLFSCGSSWGYDGPLFDAMAQIGERVDMENALRIVQDTGVDKIALFARSRKSIGQNEKDVLDLKKNFAGLLILGTPKYLRLRKDLSNKYIDSTIKGIESNDYKFIGEILYTHGDKSHGKQTQQGEIYIDPLGQGTKKLILQIQKFNIPLMTHWEVYKWDRDWPRFSKIYAVYPEQIFIIPHMAFGSPSQVKTILSQHPNVYMTVSKKLKPIKSYSDLSKQSKLGLSLLDKNKMLRDEWKPILIEYQDRLLFATDAHKPHRWKKYHKKVRHYKKLADQLSQEVAEKISYKNAEKIYNIKIQ